MNEYPANSEFYNQIIELLYAAKRKVAQAINNTMVVVYFEIGRMVIEEEQQGQGRAKYGKQLLKGLSQELTKEFGKGFSVTNLQQMRNFYFAYKNQQTLSVNSYSDKKMELFCVKTKVNQLLSVPCQTTMSKFLQVRDEEINNLPKFSSAI